MATLQEIILQHSLTQLVKSEEFKASLYLPADRLSINRNGNKGLRHKEPPQCISYLEVHDRQRQRDRLETAVSSNSRYFAVKNFLYISRARVSRLRQTSTCVTWFRVEINCLILSRGCDYSLNYVQQDKFIGNDSCTSAFRIFSQTLSFVLKR